MLAAGDAAGALGALGETEVGAGSLGDKLGGRAMARAAGVQTVPGTDHIATLEDAKQEASQLGYPVVMKASAGGGGRGRPSHRSARALACGF